MKLCQIHIERFRGIADQTISDIGNVLPLIGRNNAGKSAILAAIRTFWGDYSPTEKDFYKNSTDFKIAVSLTCKSGYLSEYFYDSKVGVMKFPATANDYNIAKVGTRWEETAFIDFKESRQSRQDSELFQDISTRQEYEPIWINSITSRLDIQDGFVNATVSCNKSDLKIIYDKKELVSILPTLAFINDSRNFEEEELGKARSVTSNIFNIILKTELAGNPKALSCDNCDRSDCEAHCIENIQRKAALDLTIEELQKLINFKAKNGSQAITDSISEQFGKNYQRNFRVNIKATSSVNKSFSIVTKIYDPALGSEIDLSNVGAGVRSVYILSLLQAYQAVSAKHTIFIIEEPELYLHPQLQKSMVNTLSKISENNQVLFTTHSPIMLKEFRSSDIRKVKLNEIEYCTVIEIATLEDILSEIGYSSQDVLNTDFIIFVEGPNDKEIIEHILVKYYDIDLNKLTVIDTKSCNNIGFYATLRFLNKTTMSSDFAIIRDADTKPRIVVREKLCRQLNENISPEYVATITNNIYITKYSAIEGFLLSANILVSHRIFVSLNNVYEQLQRELIRNKERHIQYFRNQNLGDDNRIAQFEEEYDSNVADTEANITWIKENIRGHNYFGYTNSTRISYSDYVQELPQTAFEDLLNFFDNIRYFRDKINHQ